jgi:hypothetical protein
MASVLSAERQRSGSLLTRKSMRVWPRVTRVYGEADRADDRQGVAAHLVHPLQTEGEQLARHHFDAGGDRQQDQPPADGQHEHVDDALERTGGGIRRHQASRGSS